MAEEHWRQFQGTELGGLMTQIYGNKTAQARVRYPRPAKKTVSTFLPAQSFVSSGNPSRTANPRPVRKVVVPTFSHPSSATKAQIEVIPKRRNETVIRTELDDIRMRQTHYRPPPGRGCGAEAEKERFREICAHKGGKALPDSCLPPPSETPLETRQRLAESRRIEELKARRNPLKHLAPSELSVEDRLTQQVVEEVNERRAYLEDMRRLGALRPEVEEKLKSEIAFRLREMKTMAKA